MKYGGGKNIEESGVGKNLQTIDSFQKYLYENKIQETESYDKAIEIQLFIQNYASIFRKDSFYQNLL